MRRMSTPLSLRNSNAFGLTRRSVSWTSSSMLAPLRDALAMAFVSGPFLRCDIAALIESPFPSPATIGSTIRVRIRG